MPASLDWREKRKVNAVKDQGSCGGCWSFATTATLESNHAIYTGQLLSFSEQQFIACANTTYSCAGCGGGEVWGAYQYMIDSGDHLIQELEWRYRAANSTCEYTSKGHSDLSVNLYYTVVPNDTMQLQQMLSYQPVALYIDGGEKVFQQYTTGIFDSTACLSEINHGVTAVGWGIDNAGTYFWIVRNSWGTSWGENGYIRIDANDHMAGESGICGVLYSPYTGATGTLGSSAGIF